jgi:hypothetical protein
MSTMTINEALALAEKYKAEGVISTSAQAVITLAERIKELKQMAEEASSLGDFAYAMRDTKNGT